MHEKTVRHVFIQWNVACHTRHIYPGRGLLGMIATPGILAFMRVMSIHTYPVKGCYRLDHREARVEPWGLAGDRRWLITNADRVALTQREETGMTGIRPEIVGSSLVLRSVGHPDLVLPTEAGDLDEVTVWASTIAASRVGEAADAWLSGVLDREAHLYWLDDPTRRMVDPAFGIAADRVSFADAYPLLLANSASLNALNGWLATDGGAEGPLPMTRFRPNLVIDGAVPWAEDDWLGGRLRIGTVTFRAVKPCARCVVTTTDQDTGERGREPLRTLARHRNVQQKLLFGLNLIPDGTGTVATGDEFLVE